MICPNCNSEVKDEMKFCPKCGTGIPQTRYCSECGTELKDGMCFCPKCGIRIVNLHNIPNDKYPFADNIEKNSIIESANTQIQEVKKKMKKGLKYISIGFACYLVVYIIGMCAGSDVSRFSGRFYSVCADNPNWHYIINVSKDGRCVGGLDGDDFLGYVSPISDDAFTLSDAPYTDWYLIRYRDGERVGSTGCNLRFLVFDIKNNRVYFDRNEYLNSDISNPDYSILSRQ